MRGVSAPEDGRDTRAPRRRRFPFAICLFMCFSSPPARATAPQAQQDRRPVPVQRPKPPAPELGPEPTPSSAEPGSAENDETPLPGDWAPELLDGMLSSPNSDSRDALLDAAFAAGPAVVPQLEAALKDDRTVEFAAQSLAYVGGPKALAILSKLVSDPRDLDLRRFYYGALGEFQGPEAAKVLFYALGRADAEPDRTVTEAAIIALTVRSEASLLPELRQMKSKIKDVVLRDDLDNAVDVIEARARYLASPQGRNVGGSLEQAVRSYFMPALEPPRAASGSKADVLKPRSESVTSSAISQDRTSAGAASAKHAGSERSSAPVNSAVPAQHSPAVERSGHVSHSAPASRSTPADPPVKVEIRNLTFSPDRTRALARVTFEDPFAVAYYTIVLQKQAGDWTLASVWLGSETEKPGAPAEKPARSPAE